MASGWVTKLPPLVVYDRRKNNHQAWEGECCVYYKEKLAATPALESQGISILLLIQLIEVYGIDILFWRIFLGTRHISVVIMGNRCFLIFAGTGL